MTDFIKNYIGEKLFIVLGFMLLLLGLSPALAQENVQRIAAIVNDEVISNYDVQQRINLIVFSAGIETTDADLVRMRAQVLRTLVDETLKIQEARRLEIEITKREVDQSIEGMAEQNNTTVEKINEMLEQSGTSVVTLRRQIASDLAWDTIVRGMFGNRVSVTNEEVEAVFQRNADNVNQPQYLVSEIYFRIDSPDQAATVRANAEDMLQKLRSGAGFPAIAQQFSQSASAAKGGDIGWVQDGQLAPELNEALRGLAVGQISEPIRTINAYHVLALRNRRIVGGSDAMLSQLKIRQMIFPLAPETPQAQVQAAGDYLAKLSGGIRSCGQLDQLKKEVEAGQLSKETVVVAKDLPDRFRSALLPLEVGQATAPILSQQGFHIVVLCGRQESEGKLPSMEEIRSQLSNQQMNMLARRYIRDLRNDAVVENR